MTSSELSAVVKIHSFQKACGYVCKLCKNQWTESVNGSTCCKVWHIFKATFSNVFGSNFLYKLKYHHREGIKIDLVSLK